MKVSIISSDSPNILDIFLRLLLSFCLVFCIQYPSIAQYSESVFFTIDADTNNLRIGEQITLVMTAEHETSMEVVLPALPDTLGALETVEYGTLETRVRNDRTMNRQTVTVTSFEEGSFTIPPLSMKFSQEDGTTDSIFSDALTLQFSSVPIDTAQGLKPIKAPMDMPFIFAEIQNYVFVGLGIVVCIAVALYLWKRYRQIPKPQQAVAPEPQRPAHEIALQKLRELEQKQLWQHDNVKEYYYEISLITREYIEHNFDVPALESTTYEILERLGRKVHQNMIKPEMLRVLEMLLLNSDMVKFAKEKPLPDEHLQAMQTAISFVQTTMSVHNSPDIEVVKS